jgi:DNA repair protein SbcC/Rad50
MIPLHLKLEGFASYRTIQEIDFRNRDLFVITGPTGSGKSAILDAMTFALYKRIARFDSAQGLGASTVATPGALDLRVTFEFGVRGHRYRVSRHFDLRRNTPRPTCVLEQYAGQDEDEEIWSVLETDDRAITERISTDILRLDFEKFTRVILLPQGAFDRFLKAKSTERIDILENIVGLSVYERMGSAARTEEARLSLDLQQWNGQLSALELAEAGVLENEQKNLDRLEFHVPELASQADLAYKSWQDQRALLISLNNLVVKKNQRTEHERTARQMEQLAETLQVAQQAQGLLPNWGEVRAGRNSLDTAQRKASLKREELSQVALTLEKYQPNYTQKKEEYQQQQQRLDQIKDNLQQAHVYQEQLAHATQEEQRYQKSINALQEELNQSRSQWEIARNNLDTVEESLRATERDLAKYPSREERLSLLEMAVPLVEAWSRAAENLAQEQKKLEDSNLHLQLVEEEIRQENIRLRAAESTLTQNQQLLAKAQEENLRLHTQNLAGHLREHLHTGDNCPVCGTVILDEPIIPQPLKMIDLSDLTSACDQADTAYRDSQIALGRLKGRYQNSCESNKYHQKVVLDKAESCQRSHQAASEILETTQWEVNAIKSEWQEVRKNERRHQEFIQQRNKLLLDESSAQGELQRWEAEGRRVRQAFDSETLLLKERKAERGQAEETLRRLIGEVGYSKLQLQVEQQQETLNKALQTLETDYQQYIKAYEKATNETEFAEADYQDQRQVLKAIELTWQSTLVKSNFTEETFLQALKEPGVLEGWQKQLTEYNNQTLVLNTGVQTLEQQIGNRSTDAAMVEQLEKAYARLQNECKQAQEDLIKKQQWLQRVTANQRFADDLKQKMAILQTEQEVYKTLGTLLNRGHYLAFLMEELLGELVERANRLLGSLSSSRYELLYEENRKAFAIRDAWHGSTTRRVETLSGGETFIASLALALALSEKLAGQSEVGSLFLDEGFGTLDEGSLALIRDTLFALREQNRVIGVITHVESLANQIPDRLHILNTSSGSTIQASKVL